VLSGGGAKTAAHIGATKALEEAGLAPVRYVATSMGAVIGAALAGGGEREALIASLGRVGRAGVVKDPIALVRGLFAPGLLRPAPFRSAVERLVTARRFADLAVPLTVTVVDLDSGELLLFGEGGEDAPLLDVLCATCALPVYYPPVRCMGRRCGDGGLRGPLPLDVAATLARETVVAVDVGPGFDVAGPPPAGAPPMVRAHDDAVGALMAHATATSWRSGGPIPRALRWSTSGRRSSATPHSGWTACSSTPRTATPPSAKRSRSSLGLDPNDPRVKLSRMKASEAMVADPHVAVAGAMASEVAIMLKTRNISVVPVVDDHRTRRFLGTLSDRDLVTRCLAEGKHPWHTRADTLMRTNSPVVQPEQELDGFTIRMDLDPNESHLRPTITVVNGERRVVGFISHPEQVAGIQIVWG
jgi:predicted acylesterase/phospholipase RssA